MPLEFGIPPRTRYNDLLDYPAIIAELEQHPGEYARVAAKVTRSDQDKMVRTFKQMGNFDIITRAAGKPGVDDERDVWVRTLGPLAPEPEAENGQTSER